MRPTGDQYTTTMFILAQIAVFGGFSIMLTDGHMDGRTENDSFKLPCSKFRTVNFESFGNASYCTDVR